MNTRVFRVQRPFQRIVTDVFSDAIQVTFVTDDVIIIVALPHALIEWRLTLMMNALNIGVGRDRFERPDNIAQRRGRACPCPIGNAHGNRGDHRIVGDHKGRPYDDNNAMQMIGHDDAGVQFDGWKPLRQ